MTKVDFIKNESYFLEIQSVRTNEGITKLSLSSNLYWISIDQLEMTFGKTIGIMSDFREECSCIDFTTNFYLFNKGRAYCSGMLKNENDFWSINNQEASKKKLIFTKLILEK